MYAGVPTREPRFSESLDPACVQRPGDPEVRHERAAVLGEEQVLGLDVPVNHSVVVGILERPGGVGGNPKCILHRQLRLAPQAVAETLPFDEGHGEPELPGGFPGVMNSEDMGVLQAGGEPDFTLEAFGAERRRQLGVQHLEGDRAVVPEVVGEVDRGHAAAPSSRSSRSGRESSRVLGGCAHESLRARSVPFDQPLEPRISPERSEVRVDLEPAGDR